jgi:hypothetical protein
MVDPADLDSKSQDIIWALEQLGGTANTGEIRRYTDLENTTVITYRLNGKLGPDEYGLVTTEQPPMKNGRLQPKIATLTEKGETLAAKLNAQTPEGAAALVDEVSRLQQQLTHLEAQLEADADETDPDTSDRDELDERIDTVWNATIAIRDYLIEEHDADLEAYHPRNQ